MGNPDRRSSTSKPQPAAGISESTPDLVRKVQELSTRVQELELAVNDKNQWNNVVRGWVGKEVRIRLVTGNDVQGVLSGMDRYTLGMACMEYVEARRVEKNVIVHKGAIATIELHK